MALGDWVAPGVVGGVIGGITSWLVAREARKETVIQATEAARGTIEQARIGAAVEHAKRRDARRDAARDHFEAVEVQMWTIGNPDARADVRREAAFEAHNLIARIAMILSDTFDAPRLNELLKALQTGEYDHAADIWPEVRQAIVAPSID